MMYCLVNNQSVWKIDKNAAWKIMPISPKIHIQSSHPTSSTTLPHNIHHITGKNGQLHLSFHHNGSKTILGKCRSYPPLSVQRAVYCEYKLPEMAYVYIATTSGGMLQGDSYDISFELHPKTKSHITTQGATRIYKMSKNMQATQKIHITLDENAYLEYVPDQIIPYADSEFAQDTRLVVHDTATIIYAETIASGRIGMGESFAYRSYNLKLRVVNQDGILRFVDAAKIKPLHVKSFGVMHQYMVTSTVYIITKPEYVDELQKSIEKIILHNDKNVKGGASIMSREMGVLVRLLGMNSESVKSVVNETVACARRVILDAPFTNVRKC